MPRDTLSSPMQINKQSQSARKARTVSSAPKQGRRSTSGKDRRKPASTTEEHQQSCDEFEDDGIVSITGYRVI